MGVPDLGDEWVERPSGTRWERMLGGSHGTWLKIDKGAGGTFHCYLGGRKVFTRFTLEAAMDTLLAKAEAEKEQMRLAMASQPTKKESAFAEELRSLINRNSRENESDTPDHLLAKFMLESLEAAERLLLSRDQWHGFNPWGGEYIADPPK